MLKRGFFAIFVLFLLLFFVVRAFSSRQEGNSETRSSLPCSFDFSDLTVSIYRISNNSFHDVCPGSEPAQQLQEGLVQPPGVYGLTVYTLDNHRVEFSFDATEPGLYRLFIPNYGQKQFLVWEPNVGVLPFMTDFGYIYWHGNMDDLLTIEDLLIKSQKVRLSVSCGTIAKLLSHILNGFGFETRLAVSVTLQKLNNVDDGHIMLEVKTGQVWQLFDPDSRTYFGNEKNQLGVADISPDFRPIVGANVTQYGPLMSVASDDFHDQNKVDLGFLDERSRISPASLSMWYHRILGEVGVENNSIFLFEETEDQFIKNRIKLFYPMAEFVKRDVLRN